MTELHGFIIAASDWPDDIKLQMGKGSLGTTAAEAWRRHIGPSHAGDNREFSTRVQRWSDMGYKPYRVVLAFDERADLLEQVAEILRGEK